jgi:aarF domain-containing kinase
MRDCPTCERKEVSLVKFHHRLYSESAIMGREDAARVALGFAEVFSKAVTMLSASGTTRVTSNAVPSFTRVITNAFMPDITLPSSSAVSDIPVLPKVRGRLLDELPNLAEMRVPVSAINRGFHVGGMAINMFLAGGKTERVNQLVEGLCRLRGAALKVGQLISLLPEGEESEKKNDGEVTLGEILRRVRDSAYRMPSDQVDEIMRAEIGDDWRDRFKRFDDAPIAAASIGQVHQGVLKSDGRLVAVKIQYPGVAESIDSDLANLGRILKLSGLVPKGLYLDQLLSVARDELKVECDYIAEADKQRRFRELFHDETDHVYVPEVIDELSSRRVLTSELVKGIPIDKAADLSQEERNHLSLTIIRLCLRELFEFRFMQTDPNWSNFMYDPDLKILNLIDFGASREYSEHFVKVYLKMVKACADRDREAIIEYSKQMGLLSGQESKIMLDAHVDSAYIVGEPFSTEEPYDFSGSNLTDRLSNLAFVMLKHRIAAPPIEVYSLHRKLSGAYFTCIKLKGVIPCRPYLLDTVSRYKQEDQAKLTT